MTRHGTRVIGEAVLLRLDDIVILPNNGVLVDGSLGLARFFCAVSLRHCSRQLSQS